MLQTQLNDVSSDSIPLLLLAVVARSVHHLRSLLLALLHSIGLSRLILYRHHRSGAAATEASAAAELVGSIGSGLAGLIVLADQLNQSRASSRSHGCGGGGFGSDSECVVCLSALREGEQVRELGCRHVFHTNCFDGWLHHFNFNCPLCRSPLVEAERVEVTRRSVGRDLVDWFSPR